MDTAEIQRYEEARKRLLVEGTRSYLEAVTALIEYRREVQKKCRTIMETYLDEYASALKVPLKSNEIQDAARPSFAKPSFAKWDGNLWSLGVKIVRTNITGLSWWETFCGLEYYSGEPEPYCYISEWLPTRKMALDLSRKFHSLNRSVVQERNSVWIPQTLKFEEVAAFEKSLEGVVEQWIELWNKVGGITEVFKGDG